MKKYQKSSIKYCLRGHVGSLSLRLIIKRTCNLLFVLYCFASLYLLVFDTTLIVKLNLFDNEYIAVSVCFSVVFVGFVLLLLTEWQKYKYKASVYSVFENIEVKKFTFDAVLKYLSTNLIVKLIKIFYVLAAVLPSAFLTAVGYVFIKNGMPTSIFIVLAVCDVILLLNGVINSFCIIQKFSLVDYCFSEYKNESIIRIIKNSSYLSDGKCRKLAKYKLKHCIYKFIGLLIPLFNVRETSCEFFIMTDKIIPYVQSDAHTEKPVVFYLGNVSAG